TPAQRPGGGTVNQKVLIFIPCLNIGGTEMHTLALTQSLISGGYHVTVCAYFEHDPIMIASLQDAGAEIKLLGLHRNPKQKNLLLLPRLTQALMKVIAQVRPDVLHVQYMTPGLPPLLASHLMRVPKTIATVHV